MKCLCDKGPGLCSVHSTSPYIIGCPSWGTSSESEVQKPSLSKSLNLKVDVLPQQCHKSKGLSFQFQELDSSSTQLTGQSYPEVGSAQSVQIPIQHSNSSASSTLSGTGGKCVAGLIRSSIGIQDFALAPPLLDHSQSLAQIAFQYADPCYTGLLAAAYGSQAKPYLHESRHVHALKRARGVGGRFVNTKKLQESKLTSAKHGLDVSSRTQLNLSGNMAEPYKMHKVENYRDGASTDVTCASNRDDMFQQQESDFSLCPRWKGYAGLYS